MREQNSGAKVLLRNIFFRWKSLVRTREHCSGSVLQERTAGASSLVCTGRKIGTLRYEDGKARTATALDAGNFRGSRRVAKNKMLKMCTFRKGGDVNNLNSPPHKLFIEAMSSFRL